MHIHLCGEILDRLIASLTAQIEKTYSAEQDGRLPDLVSVGGSGKDVVARLVKVLGRKQRPSPKAYTVELGEKGKTIQDLLLEDSANRSFLLCDSIVNTGKTLRSIRDHLLAQGATDVRTLTVVLRNGSHFVPNFSAMVIARNDEVFFGRHQYPVTFYSQGAVRRLDKGDRAKELHCGVDWISSRLDDYLYLCSFDPNYRVFVLEAGGSSRVTGLISFQERERELAVDVIAVGQDEQAKGYGSSLLRFLEDYCKFNNFQRVVLWAHESKVDYYRKFGYKSTGQTCDLDYGSFSEMSTPMVFNA